MVIGLVAGWTAWVSGVTDMIETVSNRIARRFWCVRLDCISAILRGLLGICGISMFGIGNVNVSLEISEARLSASQVV